MQCSDSLNPILILASTSSTFDITQTMQHAWKSHLAGAQLSCSAAQGPALPYGPQQARALRAQHLWPLSSLLLAEGMECQPLRSMSKLEPLLHRGNRVWIHAMLVLRSIFGDIPKETEAR